jgi:NADH:ubiquinone oxidoreductase subunit 2 (subunit N)
VLGSALYLTAIALLGLGLGALTRRTAGGISALFGVLFALMRPDLKRLLAYHSASSASGLAASRSPWWPDPVHSGHGPGFGLLCLYAAIALGLAACLLRRRDA